jgi:uncharacterized protein YbjT (DUF2867 family)
MTKIVVIGGTGLTGSKLVARLAEHGHKAIAASRSSGVNTLTGEGLAGTERLSESGYSRAKLAQEKLTKGSGIPYSIVHATSSSSSSSVVPTPQPRATRFVFRTR